MQKLSLSKQLAVVRLYLSGFSYDEIATRAGVGKGTVANVVGDLKAGRILDGQEPIEQLELLRNLAIELRRLKLTLGQAVTGIAIVSHLEELEIEPSEIERYVAMCRHLAGDETQAQVLVRSALYLEQLEERTGLSAEALEDKVRTLQEEVARLEPLVQELKESRHEVKNLQKQRRNLADEIGQLEKRHRPLSQSVVEKEQREAELSNRVQNLEQRAQAADERLGLARSELQTLTALGLSLDDLPGLVQRLGGVAQRHGIEPGALRDRLLHELEELDAGMGLESVVKLRQRELSEIEQTIAKAQRERVALDSALQQLRQQQASLHEAIAEEETRVRKEVGAIARIAKETVAKLQQDLGDAMAQALVEVHKLTSEALKLGQEIGHYDAMVEANQWLETLVALAKGDGASSATDVRTVGLTVLRGLNGWAHQNESQVSLPSGLTMRLNSTIEDLERWKP
jgi:chromosome segregation ATPase